MELDKGNYVYLTGIGEKVLIPSAEMNTGIPSAQVAPQLTKVTKGKHAT